jgi:hypothetical protein
MRDPAHFPRAERSLPHRPRRLFVALASLLLLACGGGTDLAGGVGSGGSGVAEGLITGFGSVIVDGVRYDDSAALVRSEDEAGQKTPVALLLGQRVRLALDGAGKVSGIEVLPQLLGPVTAQAQGGWLRVAGQWVRVDADTVLADHTDAAAIPQGTDVEVHGTWQADDTRGMVLVAAMLRNRDAAPNAPVLVSGVVHEVHGLTVTLGAAGGTQLTLPAGATLPSPGDIVALWVVRSELAQGPAVPWRALRQRVASPVEEGATLVLGGAVRAAAGRRFSVQGLELDWPEGPGAQTLLPQRGDFVRLMLRRVGDRWEVLRAEVRDEPSKLGGRVELRGRLAGVDWSARPLELTLRGVRVVIPPGLLANSSCSGNAALDVEIEAARGRLPLQALGLRCAVPAPVN